MVRRVISGTDLNRKVPVIDHPLVEIPVLDRYGDYVTMGFDSATLSRGVGAIGPTGSGKTYFYKKCISSARKNASVGTSYIIIQAKNDYNSEMQPGDLIIDQHNAASVNWNLFNDLLYGVEDEFELDRNINEFCKMVFSGRQNQTQQFFSDAARIVLSVILKQYINQGLHNLEDRSKLSNRGLKAFFDSFNNADFRRIINQNAEHGLINMVMGEGNSDNLTALGVCGELVTVVLDFLAGFSNGGESFSIREFVDSKEGKALFINYDPNYKETEKVVYGAILKLALKQITAQNSTVGDTFVLVDELIAVGKTDLPDFLNLGGAKGLKAMVGMQSYAQLVDIYGNDAANAFYAGLRSKVFFSPGDPKTREVVQKELGKCIVEELVLSVGGTNCNRVERNAIDDEELNSMGMGDIIVKDDVKKHIYRAHIM